MSQNITKLKIISRPASGRSKNQTLKTQPSSSLLSSIKKQISTQTEEKKSLLTCQSSKTLYKQKYQQCQQRLGEENQYLREYMMDLNLKVSERDNEIYFLKQNNQKLRNQRDELEIEIKTLEENEKNKQRQYHDVLEDLRKQSSQRVSQYTSNINSLREMMSIREKCISELRSNISANLSDISKFSTENESLKIQLEQLTRSKIKQSNHYQQKQSIKPEKRRAKSTFNSHHLRQLVISQERQTQPQLSPKQAARMDVLLDQYNELKSIVSKGNIDSGTGFRLITLIQYLKQTLNKKNLENAELNKKYGFKGDTKHNEIIDKYQKTIFQCRQQIQSLQCEIRILKDQRIECKGDEVKPFSHRNRSNYQSISSSRRNSNTSIIHMSSKKEFKNSGLTVELERLINKQQQNNWRLESAFSQTQHLPYRQIAKKQLIQKLDSSTTLFNDTRRIRQSGGLSERRNSAFINLSQVAELSYVYTKYNLSQFLKKRNDLITYMNLVVKITEIVDKMIKSQNYRILTTKDILIMICEGSCPDSMRMKCELKVSEGEQEVDEEFSPPELGDCLNQLSVMWSIGVIFKKIYESIQTDNAEEEELFRSIVKPQFDKIVESLVVDNPLLRMDMSTFKEMLTTLS